MTATVPLTQSKYRTYRDCPRKFYLRHEARLEPKASKPGLRRGTIFGNALFAVSKREQQQESPLSQASTREALWETVNAAYQEIHPDSQQEADELALEAVKLVEIAYGYIVRYGVEKHLEVVYHLPLRNPATGACSRTFHSAGKIDGVKSLGGQHARVIENKLMTSIQKAMIDKIALDVQVTEYVDALAQKGWTAEVAYRHTRWPGINPNPPKEYKTRANYPGETLFEFGLRLAGDIQDRQDFYYHEQILTFDMAMLEDHRNERWRTSQDIVRSKYDLKRGLPLAQAFPRNSSRCADWGGCAYIPLCTGMEGAGGLYEVGEDSPELRG